MGTRNFIHPDGRIISWIERPADKAIRVHGFKELVAKLQLTLPPPGADKTKFDSIVVAHRQEDVRFSDTCLGLNIAGECRPERTLGATMTYEIMRPAWTLPQYVQYRCTYARSAEGLFVKVFFANGGPIVPLAPVVKNEIGIYEQA